jgi:hypothetical protein
MTRYEILKLTAFGIVARECSGGVIQCCVPACPIQALEMLHLDHIKNDGHRHRKRHNKAGGVHTYQWVVKHPKQACKRLQILCANHDRMKQVLGSVEAIVKREDEADQDQDYSEHQISDY